MAESDRDRAVQLARDEVKAKCWAMTRQFLADQDVVRDDQGEPVVAGVVAAATPRTFHVFFPIRDEKYLFVAIVGPEDSGELELQHHGVWAGTSVYLGVFSETVTVEEITTRVGCAPTEVRRKSEPISRRVPGGTVRWNIWRLEPDCDRPGLIEDKLETLLDAVEPYTARIATLGSDCQVSIQVVSYEWIGNGCIGGFSLSPRTMRRIAALGASVSTDLYVSGPWLRGGD